MIIYHDLFDGYLRVQNKRGIFIEYYRPVCCKKFGKINKLN